MKKGKKRKGNIWDRKKRRRRSRRSKYKREENK
jgi:hypothetical protein